MISRSSLLLLSLVIVAISTMVSADVVEYSYSNPTFGNFAMSTMKNASWECEIDLKTTRMTTGWDLLTLTVNPTLVKDDPVRAYKGCGYAEGFLTYQSILDNNYSSQGTADDLTNKWLDDNVEWMKKFPSQENTTTANGILRLVAFAEGMTQGINEAVKAAGTDVPGYFGPWTLRDMIALMAQAEMGDISTAAHLQAMTTTAAPAPTTSAAPAPTSTSGAPTTSTGAPTTSTGAPTTSTGAPTTSTGAPTTSTGAPTTSTAAPTTSTGAPTTSTAAPTTSTGAPTTSTAAPTTSTAAPTTSTAAPTTSTAAPTSSTAAPTSSTAAPTSSTAAPTSSTAAPTSSTAAAEEQPIILERTDNSGGMTNRGPSGSHCSGSVVRTKDDLAYSHVTWSGFSTMIRTFKTYNFETSVSFSSYPGQLSLDDWLITGNKLGIQETTNSFVNNALFKQYVLPQNALTFMRTFIAALFADTTQSFSDIFLNRNSGTYNNQFMVVDYKKINKADLEAGKDLPTGTFLVLEQAPGPHSVSQDQTSYLNTRGYWKSFNLAFYQAIRDINGDQASCDKYGNYFCYDKYSRSMIFDRNLTEGLKRTDFGYEDVEALQSYNGASFDALSKITTATKNGEGCDGCTPDYSYLLAISSRADLIPLPKDVNFGNLSSAIYGGTLERFAFGGIDVKLSSYKLLSADEATGGIKASIRARSGPTTSGNSLPVFDWKKYEAPPGTPEFNLRHRGQPTKFEFAPITANVVLPNHQAAPWPNNNGAPKGKGLSAGAEAGIAIGCLFVVGVIGFIIYKKRQAANQGTGGAYQEVQNGGGSYQTL